MKDLIILGRGQSWKDCPFDAECWAIASVLNDPEISKHQIHKVFAFDDYALVKSEVVLARGKNIPIMSTQGYASEPYPLKEITEEFGQTYFRTSVSYMIAYAIYKGYEKLRLYGIDQAPEWVHIVNKPYVMFWLGVATGRGVKWELSKYSILLETMGPEIEKYIVELKAKASTLKKCMESQLYRG